MNMYTGNAGNCPENIHFLHEAADFYSVKNDPE